MPHAETREELIQLRTGLMPIALANSRQQVLKAFDLIIERNS